MRKIAFAIGLLFAGCIAASAEDAPHAAFGTWGVDLSAMDKSVKPGDDFFRYVNGAWLKTATIPPDRTSTGSFQDLRLLSEKRLREIIADLDARAYDSLTPEEKKLRDLYDAFEDRAQIDARGLAPVQRDLTAIQNLKTKDDIARAMGSVPMMTSSIFDASINIEDKHPNSYAINLTQSGLGLPDRDYYLRDDKDLAAAREAYRQYLATMMGLAGMSDAQTRADRVFALETQLAQAHWPIADRRDRNKIYNPMSIAQLKKYAPQFNWDTYFAELGVSPKKGRAERIVVVREMSAFPKLAQVFDATPVDVWRDYLTVHYLHAFSAFLPQAFDDADFSFYGKVLSGTQTQLDRPTRGVHLLDGTMGEALGKLYVAKYFSPEAKAKAVALVENMRRAYEADIKTLDWMTDATKAIAADKLHHIALHIGYPDKWRDYSAYTVSRDDLIGDIQRGAVFEWNRELKRIDGPVDRGEWTMTPPTINASYYPPMNEITFPAAILQPPFFDPNADDAANYGGIGAVIGHEMSHGFDDQGSRFNAFGVLENWWTDTDRKNFDARTAALAAQYDQYEPLPGLHVNGKLTLGENIGDLSGLSIALKAYRLSLGNAPAPVLDGYTGDQRFFLSFGQIWRSLYRDAATRQLVLSNPHAPAQFRVDGVTRNIDDWYVAFDVKPGDKYYLPPEQRVHLW